MYFIYGKGYPSFTPEQALVLLTEMLDDTLSQPLPTDALFACVGQFVKRLEDNAFLPQLDAAVREEVSQFCQPEALRFKLEHELGDAPFSLRRFNFSRPHFESWRPLGVVLHITPANAQALPFLAIVESLLVGNINWLRPSASEKGLTLELLQGFLDCDATNTLAKYFAILPVSTDRLALLMAHVDGISAWGGDAALNAIRHQLPGGCRWIPWGHKISFSWLMPDAIDDRQMDALADEICRFDQLACSSSQIVFVDTESLSALTDIGDSLAQAMHRRCGHWPFQQPDEKSAADITSAQAISELDRVFTGADNRCWNGDNWRILLQNTVGIEPSPLYRTLLLRPLPRHKLIQTLRPWRRYLQTCSLAATEKDMVFLSQLLLTAGVNRITPLAGMHSGYSGEPHDGIFALSQLVRRVTVTLDAGILPGLATLDLPSQAPCLPVDQPVMDRAAFTENAIQPGAKLFFRSGGSSGVPKLAGFTYRDYHLQMQAAADGMFAAGLDPAKDKVLSLMYAGNLYGGLLSFFTVLDKAGVMHLPMGGPHDDNYEEIAKTIVSQQVNTLTGMPSTLYQLFHQQASLLRSYGGIHKLLTGGEHISAIQRAFFHGFGIEMVRSALYGSVDAGPLGYSCSASPEGVFHLMADIQWLEIVNTECDKPVGPGEVGRLLFTSRVREGHRVVRYDIGDLGRWVEGRCACGALTPRFELLGRHGNLIRIGTMFIPVQQLAQLAEVPVQLILDHNPSSGWERIRILAEGDTTEVQRRVSSHPELLMGLEAGLLEIEVTCCPFVAFERHPQSGKTPLVIDKRR
ncbi:acyl-CoA reductase [Erwinia psidii]|uniref:long-chain-fatty-acyl-CoA reductase n=1 Tax=Erwinia psidii TaxID=69224 RepID=A0A3N6S9W4_9GAMM|nr:acyl-CoA reductase [Erwinia psidii]MCX8959008.1 long-chain-fatty-acyl-CoA reductase [Erwinia psidii]MCX8962792.1 long-chain-fatty-acyl-CoA reductase [Erwinia psidii]MCX8966110.1 long-chain-fatty-acyl-CoA reductase [Erwinia psidii]RQM36763.1 long-chain-fatty-acyl-CoA reductase [Erwinia psidii]